jgi:cysteine-rich repeat protein
MRMDRLTIIMLALVVGCGDDAAGTTDGGTSGETDSAGTTSGAGTTGSTMTDSGTSGTTAPDSVCGDGVVEGAETCDDGEDNGAGAACTPDCASNVCGDGFPLARAEECDDGNDQDADGCEADCSLPACANQIIDPGEVCLDDWIVLDHPGRPTLVRVADFDEDGSPDIALLNAADDQVVTRAGDGAGGFAAAAVVDTKESITSLMVGDLNADDHADILTTGGGNICIMLPCPPAIPGEVTVWLGNGDGTFATAQAFAAGDTPREATLTDLDGDGSLDVVVAETMNTLYVLLGTGDVSLLGAAQGYPVSAPPWAVAAGDLDGDGSPEVVAAGGTDVVWVLPGLGDGSLGAATEFTAGTVPRSIAIAELGEGGLDVLVANSQAAEISLMVGDGDGALGDAEAYLVNSNPTDLLVTDLSQDGIPDFAVANTQPNLVTVAVGGGDHTFEVLPALEPGGTPRALDAGDFDGNGAMDLVIARGSADKLAVFLAVP